MKKVLLSLAITVGTVALSYGQFNIGATHITFTGNTVPAGTTQGQFYSHQPNNDGGTMYSNDICTTPITQGAGGAEVGGFDPSVYSQPNGIAFYGGRIRTVYYGGVCTAQIPSFGFNTGTNAGIGAGSDVDLTAAAHQRIQFSYQSDAAIQLEIQLFDAAYNTKLENVTVNLIGDNTLRNVDIDFSGNIASGAAMGDVRQVSFLYSSTTLSPDFGIIIGNIRVGSSVVNSTTKSSAISQSNLFPNPTTGTTTITAELKSTSDVKVVLMNMLGQEVKVITEANTNSINASFETAALNKGIYSVVYQIDGVTAKSELLVVR